MIFHRLRLISFSKSLLSLKGSSKKNTDVKGHTEDVSEVVVVSKPKVAQKKQDIKENTTECAKNNSRVIPVKPRLEFKSKSETFRIPSRALKKRTTRKTLSLSDLKRRFSLKDSLNSNRIREKIQSFKKEKTKRNKNITKEPDIKVLYVAQSKPLNRRRPKHHRKLAMPQSSCDLFGFYRNKRLIDPYTFYHRYNMNDNPFQKLRTRSARKKKKLREATTTCPYTHHPLKVVTSGKIKDSQSNMTGCCTDPLHYNLLRFPQTSKSKLRKKNSLRLYRSEALSNVCDNDVGCYYSVYDKKPHKPKPVPKKMSRDQTVSTSNFKAPVVCVDMAISTCKSFKLPINSKKSCTIKTSIKSSSGRRKCKRSVRKFPISMIYSKIFHQLLRCTAAAHSRNGSSTTRNVVKYILLSLVVLVWSPCIIGVGVGWLLSYPLRPQHVISPNNRKKYKCSDECYISQCQYDWWATFICFSKRVSKEARKALSSLIRSKDQTVTEDLPQVPHSRSHPDPGRRYTLYHADGRGWVIKPDHKNVRVPPNKNRFMQIFQNLFCDCDHPKISQHSSRTRRRTNTTSHDTCATCCPEKQLDSNLRDKICLTPSKPQKPKGTSKPYTQPEKMVCRPIQEAVGKKTVSGKLADTKQLDKNPTDKICLTPSKPQKPKGTFKSCTQPEQMVCRPIKEAAGKESVSGKHVDTKQLDINLTDKISLTPSKPRTAQKPEGSSKSCVQRDKIVCSPKEAKSADIKKTSHSCHIHKASIENLICPVDKTSSGKRLDIKHADKVCLALSKQKPDGNSTRPCTTSICSGLLQVKRSRSTNSLRRSGSELVQLNPVRSRSVSKKNEAKRSTKPDRIAITERGPVLCSGEPQKIINIKVCKTKPTQTTRQAKGPATKKTQVGKPPAPSPMPPPRRRGEAKPVTRPSKKTCECKKMPFNVIGYVTKIFPKKKIIKVPFCRRFGCWLRRLGRKTAESIDSFDEELYKAICPVEVRCQDAYIHTLHSRPWFWVYRCCPSSYPAFLRWYYCSKTCCYHCMFSISLCFWAPIACWCYICYQLCLCCCN